MAVSRSATARWTGTIVEGSGEIAVDSGAFPVQSYHLAARIGEPGGRTSPEELLAAAHASCLAMEIAARLTGNGTPASELKVTATATEGPVADGFAVTGVDLRIRGRVPGLQADAFVALATEAATSCPIGRAISGSVPISVDAALES